MKEFSCFRGIYVMGLMVLMLVFFMPNQSNAMTPLADDDLSENSPSLTQSQPDSGLHPIDERQLDDLSPALVAPAGVETPTPLNNQQIARHEFENSICFKRCHQISDFRPSDNTAKQWRLLIREDGHSLFQDIPWENAQQKEDILNYLLDNARNTRPEPAGIGVW